MDFEGEAPGGGYWTDGIATVEVRYGDRVATVETPIGYWGGGWAGTPASERDQQATIERRTGHLGRSDFEWCTDGSADEEYNPMFRIVEAIMEEPDAVAIIDAAMPDPADVESLLVPLYIAGAMSGIETPEPPTLEELYDDAVAIGDPIEISPDVRVRAYGVADLAVWTVEYDSDDVCLFTAKDAAMQWARALAEHLQAIADSQARLRAMLDDDGDDDICLRDGECLGVD
jgi:hypothetical protein